MSLGAEALILSLIVGRVRPVSFHAGGSVASSISGPGVTFSGVEAGATGNGSSSTRTTGAPGDKGGDVAPVSMREGVVWTVSGKTYSQPKMP
jgi:hypothetical protein